MIAEYQEVGIGVCLAGCKGNKFMSCATQKMMEFGANLNVF